MSNNSEKLVKDIRRRTRKKYSAEEKIRIVLEGLRGEDSIAELCRKEGNTYASITIHCCMDHISALRHIAYVCTSAEKLVRGNLRATSIIIGSHIFFSKYAHPIVTIV